MQIVSVLSTIFFLLVLAVPAQTQTVCTPESRERLETFLERLSGENVQEKNINGLLMEIGSWFLGTPYVEKTLELPGPERLVVNLTGLDCTTYLETVLALARVAKQGNLRMEAYEKELERIRYQQGKLGEYPSRLHYFTDWIYQNEQKGLVRDITQLIGGQPYENKPTFMSSNPKYYAQLNRTDYVEALTEAEKAIAKRSYFYIPKAEIHRHERQIQSGDLIAITTTLPNLDVVHVGFAVEQGGRIHLMHASLTSKEVEISAKTLQDYLMGNKSQSGIVVSRAVDLD
ncbi:N-acetylmuramoyl-L-alanine amidase-like domain-containing protein [Lunatimonas salinarum]|uniref:N-acetylmuramoyl-L-alanine amidase-like domain-containing protein n=1 Tax=Lunatimonas salinarum TaxID=1774590 RepID=UPI001ADF49AE|nr:N-acetylmuramoyl-L-alanine amidase-like domain-containing protein [Lunatimonas salinarum]